MSREPRRQTSSPEPAKPEPRRHRTGRNVQLNIKATAHTVERFHKIADSNRWILGDTFDRAIAALERELASSTL
ncbi:MAG: hypothetical protein ABR989_14925 [Candidatus Binatus soli]